MTRKGELRDEKKTNGHPGERLLEIRAERNLDQAGFGYCLGLSQTQVYALEESGDISETIAIAIENEYGVRREWLLKGQEPKYPDNNPRVLSRTQLEIRQALGPKLYKQLKEAAQNKPQPLVTRNKKRKGV